MEVVGAEADASLRRRRRRARAVRAGLRSEVTRFFSWGPYTSIEQAEAYIAGLAGERERGERLDFLIVDRSGGPLGVTGLTELSRRDRRAVVGTWLGRAHWGRAPTASPRR